MIETVCWYCRHAVFFCFRSISFPKYLLICQFSLNFASMKRTLIYILLGWMAGQMAFAQQACLSKLSPMLRRYVLEQRAEQRRGTILQSKSLHPKQPEEELFTTAFVKLAHADANLLRSQGCRMYARWGNVYIASLPMSRLAKLSSLPQVLRIEANMSTKCTMDSAIVQVNAIPVYEGRSLPQAYTGKGVVMGIMDIGFDLTHPNFYDMRMSEYRIKALWDMISSDTLQSTLPVGRDFVGEEALLAQGCSTDGHDQTHGTHTLGIAAGSGGEGVSMVVPGKYHGVAYESDICLVANATSENQALIAPSQLSKFTYAMDALGFKYIFDYADKVGKPCVISFSEGAGQDFDGEDVLYNEVLDSLTSIPGHVIVSSAGNNGHLKYYMHKPVGKESAGFFANNSRSYVYHIAKSAQPFTFRTSIYEGKTHPTPIDVTSEQVLEAPDSTYFVNLVVAGKQYELIIGAYPSVYHPDEICYDWIVKTDDEEKIGTGNYISYQTMGADADVEVFHGSGNMYVSSVDPSLTDVDGTHSINAPSAFGSVICVGATINHTYSIDLNGNKQNVQVSPIGSLADYSSQGPTFAGLVKPDVVAPGSNVVASYSSFYEESHPTANDILNSDVAHFDYQGRTYAWNNNAGTSMASPVVGGAVALWLQANPTLNRQDVMEIIKKTSKPLDESREVPNNDWGYGEIDVYRGLLAALQLDGISEISQYQPKRATIGIGGGEVVVGLDAPSTSPLVVSIYNTAGIKLKTEKMSVGQQECRIDLSGLPSAVYVVQVAGNQNVQGSSLVRK